MATPELGFDAILLSLTLLGTELTFAYVLSDKVDKVSRPITVTLD